MKKHYNITVEGRVQGVFFRHTARQKALEFGLNGRAENMADATVRIELEGESESLDDFVKWCWIGSKSAEVSQVRVEEGIIRGFEGFEVN